MEGSEGTPVPSCDSSAPNLHGKASVGLRAGITTTGHVGSTTIRGLTERSPSAGPSRVNRNRDTQAWPGHRRVTAGPRQGHSWVTPRSQPGHSRGTD